MFLGLWKYWRVQALLFLHLICSLRSWKAYSKTITMKDVTWLACQEAGEAQEDSSCRLRPSAWCEKEMQKGLDARYSHKCPASRVIQSFTMGSSGWLSQGPEKRISRQPACPAVRDAGPKQWDQPSQNTKTLQINKLHHCPTALRPSLGIIERAGACQYKKKIAIWFNFIFDVIKI